MKRMVFKDFIAIRRCPAPIEKRAVATATALVYTLNLFQPLTVCYKKCCHSTLMYSISIFNPEIYVKKTIYLLIFIKISGIMWILDGKYFIITIQI